MFAIVRIKGFQYLTKPGEKLIVPRFDLEPNSEITLEDVLFLKTDNQTLIGNPKIKGASVTAKILGHIRAPKVTVFKFIRRENYRRLKGHKQPLTEIEITKINCPSKVDSAENNNNKEA
ncbi:MAG: 50S ribosomal protein L21 [candidate division WOR-3 bacterium]